MIAGNAIKLVLMLVEELVDSRGYSIDQLAAALPAMTNGFNTSLINADAIDPNHVVWTESASSLESRHLCTKSLI